MGGLPGFSQHQPLSQGVSAPDPVHLASLLSSLGMFATLALIKPGVTRGRRTASVLLLSSSPSVRGGRHMAPGW